LDRILIAMSIIPDNFATSIGGEPAWEIATLFPSQGDWTVEEYLELTDSTNRLIEFTNGRIEVLEMPTMAHQLILAHLFSLLRSFVKDRSLGEVLCAGIRVQADARKFREPDILYLSRERLAQAGNRYVNGGDLALEVVSDDAESRDRDLVQKRSDYAAAGIAEYWIVDPREKRITVLTLAGGTYAVHSEGVPGQQVASALLAGLVVDVAQTFEAAQGFAN
jgi:Uma2 family endonuclease